MFNKALITRLMLKGFLFSIFAVNVFAEELLEKEPSDRSNIESQSSISIQTLGGNYSVLSNYVNEFSKYKLSKQSKPSYRSP